MSFQPATTTEIIPVLAETLRIETREIETGHVTVHKTVTERDEVVDALLKRQDIEVERVAIDRVVTEAPPVRQEGDTMIVPILEERLVVEKRLVLKEELHIRTIRSERAVQQTVRLRTEHATIDEHPPTPGDTP